MMSEQDQEVEEQASAAHPTDEESRTVSSVRRCGTPGCALADGHKELCVFERTHVRGQCGCQPSPAAVCYGSGREVYSSLYSD